MMDKLPPEILQNIFNRLHLYQKVECKRVCRSWCLALDEYCLFNKVEVSDKDPQFEGFMAMMKQSPHLAARVDELRVVNNTLIRLNKIRFVNAFPNARVMKMCFNPCEKEIRRRARYCIYRRDPPVEMMHSTSKIRVLHDSFQCELAAQVLACNRQCAILEELELDFDKTASFRVPVLLNCLKGLPVLKKLGLIYPTISLTDLENIHKNIPTIQEFNLRWIKTAPSTMPSDIVPASSITTFEISIYNTSVDADCLFYQYMYTKYTNITKIKHNNMQLVQYTPDQSRHVHLNGLLDFYTRIINTNKNELSIYGTPNDIDIFEICDGMNCQLEELRAYGCQKETLFQYLSGSNQSKYVKKLALHDTRIGSPSTLKNMMALTDLRLSFDQRKFLLEINLTEYLNGTPPTLKHFLLHGPLLKVEPQKWQLYSIETLDISCRNIDATHVNMISALFPKLVELKVSVTTSIADNLHIRLYYPTLKKATFTLQDRQRRSYFLSFKSSEQTRSQDFHIRDGECYVVSYQRITNEPVLTVTTLTEKIVVTLSVGTKLIRI